MKIILLRGLYLYVVATFFVISTALANEANVIDVEATQLEDKTWEFAVTIEHQDKDWDHYVNEWVVLSPEGKMLAKRTLYHPHVHEQPFKRDLQGIKIPDKITTVTVVAHDTIHGLGGQTIEVNLKKHMKTTQEKAGTTSRMRK